MHECKKRGMPRRAPWADEADMVPCGPAHGRPPEAEHALYTHFGVRPTGRNPWGRLVKCSRAMARVLQ